MLHAFLYPSPTVESVLQVQSALHTIESVGQSGLQTIDSKLQPNEPLQSTVPTVESDSGEGGDGGGGGGGDREAPHGGGVGRG